MPMVLDELDKRILHEICGGIASYDDLAKTLKVTRGTVYRRIDKLEKTHAIRKRIMAIPDYDNLNLSAVIVGFNADYKDMDKVIEAIKTMAGLKILWRTYGSHQVVAVLNCEKGNEGETITKLHKTLSELNTAQYDVSVGFEWKKVEISPY
jgi:DNA-binding Lrp family transcriptional regulator